MKKIKPKNRFALWISGLGIVAGVFFNNCSRSGFSAVGSIDEITGADPFLAMAWHVRNTSQKVFSTVNGKAGNDLNLQRTWESGIDGRGIKIMISDDGVEDEHEDLHSNFLYTGVSKDYTKPFPYLANSSPPRYDHDSHGTAVAGLLAAAMGNGVGSAGVAPKASFAVANFISKVEVRSNAMLVDQAGGEFDVYNMSWGRAQNNLVEAYPLFIEKMKERATNGRGGKGSVYVKSAGNDFIVSCHNSGLDSCIGNSNFDGDNSTPYTILTAALNASGFAASYSSMGSNIWISSFGGEHGVDAPAMITTDRMGCNKGFAISNPQLLVPFERGLQGNSNCNYTATFNGASAAAPILTGAIALMLQANPGLTWRDVKYILAKTAIPVDYYVGGAGPHPLNEPMPAGAVWEQSWITNAAGFRFQNYYGFGRINVDDAIDLARNYKSGFGPLQETGWADEAQNLNLAIPDNSSAGASSSFSVSTDLKLEAVQLRISATHANISELGIELTSPAGTKSILVNMNNSLRGIPDFNNNVFLSNAFYGEHSKGIWKMKVIDGKAGNSGTLKNCGLNFFGSI